ncbi:unnamed protein product [Cylicocyclus nassatus]|uniref:Vesicular, overexpressed in cancer, prosurvival protein 1 n=1 Tax=Cylicocyclus nassatus TaxID=53992 RepID=A0AA36GM48_CYLNA|nr:unnamed protein product [Cylicocyclus nassatus]
MSQIALITLTISSVVMLALAQTIRTTETVYAARDTRTDSTLRRDNRDALWCPTYQVGTMCPEDSFFSYYTCCGHLHKECCSHMRIWVLLLLIGLPLLCILPLCFYFLRRLMNKRRTTQRYSSGVQMGPRDTTNVTTGGTREVREIRTVHTK